MNTVQNFTQTGINDIIIEKEDYNVQSKSNNEF